MVYEKMNSLVGDTSKFPTLSVNQMGNLTNKDLKILISELALRNNSTGKEESSLYTSSQHKFPVFKNPTLLYSFMRRNFAKLSCQ
jgi:hypothetical protein